MCPKCGGTTVQKPLFTSLYDHCPQCDAPKQAAPAHAEADQAPFVIGDTVYAKYGSNGTPRIVNAIEKKKIRTIKGVTKEVWYMRFKDGISWRECDRYEKRPQTKAA